MRMGRTPSASRARATVNRASLASCITSASAYHGASPHAGSCAPASTSTSADATSSGASGVGASSSSGMNTTCVGTTVPAPAENSTRATTAYATTSSAASSGSEERAAGASTASPPAAIRNAALKPALVQRSRRASACDERARVSASSRSSSGPMSLEVDICPDRAWKPASCRLPDACPVSSAARRSDLTSEERTPRRTNNWEVRMGSIKRALCVLVAAGAAALATAAPAEAGLLVAAAPDCKPQAASQVFLRWLDPLRYEQAPGGNAESAARWTLSGGARIVAGNEPWKVGRSRDGNSLLLPRGSRATTGVMCVGIGKPVMRFFAKRTSGFLLDSLSVEVLYETAGGQVASLPVGVVLGGGSWQPTLPLPVLASLLPLLPGEQTPVAFRFTPVGGGSWQIDDVYVDPWRYK